MRARRILAKRSQWRFGRRSHGERPTCGCSERSRAAIHYFRPVIYNDPRNLRAHEDSDGFWRNERNAHFGETKPTRFWRKQLRGRREKVIVNLPNGAHFPRVNAWTLPRFNACPRHKLMLLPARQIWPHGPLRRPNGWVAR